MKTISSIVFLFLVLRPAVSAQELSLDVGAKVGAPLTRVVDPLSVTNGFLPAQVTTLGPRIAVSPTMALIVANRVTVELDAVFKPVRFRTVETEACCTFNQSVRATFLEVPLFVSYRLANRWRPFFGGGFVVNDKAWGRIDHHNIFHDRGELETRVTTPFQSETVNARNLTPPLVVGGGFEFKAGVFGLRPELRYSHRPGRGNLDLFLGLTFRAFHAKGKPRN